jgi:hypothetical protein
VTLRRQERFSVRMLSCLFVCLFIIVIVDDDEENLVVRHVEQLDDVLGVDAEEFLDEEEEENKE